MKRLLLIFTLLGSCLGLATAQDLASKDVPEAVKAALMKRYPNASDLEWEKHKTNFKADFDIERMDHTVVFDPSGKVLMTKRDIQKTDLPDAILSTINQKYKSMRLDDMEEVKRGGKTYYQVELDEKGKDHHYVYSADGKAVTTPAYWD